MGIEEKLAKAKKATWMTDGLTDSEVKSMVEIAKISARIERKRIEMEMTQKEFADYMGVSQGMVSKWESREYNFTIKTLNDICQKLGLDLCISIENSEPEKDFGKIIKWDENKIKKLKGMTN